MNRLLAYSLMSVGALSFLFFLNYRGTWIPLKELWIVLSLFIIVVGAYYFAKDKLRNQDKETATDDRLARIDSLKQNGDKVRVSLENAEIKTRRYQQEVIGEGFPSDIQMLDGLYDSNSNYKTEEVQQTYIVFYKQYGGKTYKFVSQATSGNADTFKRYIDLQKGVDLYIDRQNPANYYFDLPFL